MKIVTIGETGPTKSRVTALLAGQGHDVLAAASNGVDTLTGEVAAQIEDAAESEA
jgi:hypothetical protein